MCYMETLFDMLDAENSRCLGSRTEGTDTSLRKQAQDTKRDNWYSVGPHLIQASVQRSEH